MRKFYVRLISPFLFILWPIFSYATTSANASPFDISSYIDGSYNYLSRSNHFISGIHDRSNDIEPNGFTLQQAGIILSRQPAHGWGGLLDVLAGRDVKNIQPFGMNISTGIQNIGFTVSQAYLQYAASSFTTIGGEFDSLSGFETYTPIGDTNFSRGLISAYAQPGIFLGVRETYVPDSAFLFFAGVNNGWDTIEDTSRRATFELGMIYTPHSQFSFSIQGYNGQQRATDGVTSGPTGIRNGLDLIATYNATPKLSYILNYDYVIQNRANLPNAVLGEAIWQGVAGYVNYTINERWQTSVRGEIFSDYNGFSTGVQQTLKEVTLTLGYSPIKKLTIHIETRRDVSSAHAFLDKNGHGVGNNLQSFGLEALYVFS